jgi:hypothetical protein
VATTVNVAGAGAGVGAISDVDTTATSITITLSGTATVYYVVTAINDGVESLSNTTPVAATTPFECKSSQLHRLPQPMIALFH